MTTKKDRDEDMTIEEYMEVTSRLKDDLKQRRNDIFQKEFKDILIELELEEVSEEESKNLLDPDYNCFENAGDGGFGKLSQKVEQHRNASEKVLIIGMPITPSAHPNIRSKTTTLDEDRTMREMSNNKCGQRYSGGKNIPFDSSLVESRSGFDEILTKFLDTKCGEGISVASIFLNGHGSAGGGLVFNEDQQPVPVDNIIEFIDTCRERKRDRGCEFPLAVYLIIGNCYGHEHSHINTIRFKVFAMTHKKRRTTNQTVRRERQTGEITDSSNLHLNIGATARDKERDNGVAKILKLKDTHKTGSQPVTRQTPLSNNVILEQVLILGMPSMHHPIDLTYEQHCNVLNLSNENAASVYCGQDIPCTSHLVDSKEHFQSKVEEFIGQVCKDTCLATIIIDGTGNEEGLRFHDNDENVVPVIDLIRIVEKCMVLNIESGEDFPLKAHLVIGNCYGHQHPFEGTDELSVYAVTSHRRPENLQMFRRERMFDDVYGNTQNTGNILNSRNLSLNAALKDRKNNVEYGFTNEDIPRQ